MIERNSRVIRDLEAALQEELRLQQEYLRVMTEERSSITAFKADRVEELSAQREILSEKMKAAADKRLELMGMFPKHEGKRLTELVSAHCHPHDQARLLPLAQSLKTALDSTKKLSIEFKQLTNFSLNLINGSLSILWSATQNITRSYTQDGKIKESAHAGGARASGVLKEA